MYNILFTALQKTAGLFHPLIAPFEYSMKKNFWDESNSFPPVFIIGVPRSGSTFLYQVLSNYFDVLYFDNLTHIFYRDSFIGFKLSHLLFKNKAHNCYKSKFGDTFSYGLHKPSEAGLFWYQWIKYLQYFVNFDELSVMQRDAIKGNINAIINYYKKPFLIKNLSNSMRIRMLKQLFPFAKYIYLKRDPRFTAQSMVEAREKLNIKPHEIWSVKPKNYEKLINMEENEKVVKQIFMLENQINEDIKYIDPSLVYSVHYEDMFSDFKMNIEQIRKFISPQLQYRGKFKEPFMRSEPNKVKNAKLFNALEKEVKKLNWSMYEIEK